MNDLIKLPYEISLWEDRLTLVDEDGNEYDSFVEDDIEAVAQYYKEKKICVIGSNTMDSLFRAVEPNLVRKTDGTSTLTFSVYNKIYDKEKKDFVQNPFVKYLTNERKVKLKYYPNGELRWLDFVIKKIEETSENYKFKYTATDLFINELSKTGYSLEFDTELENNQGTVQELAEKVLEQSDWSVGEDGDIIQQLKEEPLYEIVLGADLEAYDIFTNTKKVIEEGKTIYAFYSSIFDGESDYFQFIYNDNDIYTTDEKGIIHDVGNYYCKSIDKASQKYCSKYRGEKYIRSQSAEYDKILGKYVNVYQDESGKKIYGYTETEYFTPSLVTNYVTNGNNIYTSTGWDWSDQSKDGAVPVKMKPSYQENTAPNISRIFGLEATASLKNSGLRDNAEIIGEIAKNSKFVFRIKVVDAYDEIPQVNITVNNANGETLFGKNLYDEAGKVFIDDEGCCYVTNITVNQKLVPLSYEDLTNPEENEQFYININFDSGTKPYHIQKVELFAQHNGETEDGTSGIILPNGYVLTSKGEISSTIAQSYTKTEYYYYYPDEEDNKNATKPEEIKYTHIGEKKDYTPVYRANFEKIRSISKKETNRFDLLQTLSETFECWCRFDVWHKETGEILLLKDLSLLIDSGNAFSTEKTIFLGGTGYTTTDEIVLNASENARTNLEPQYKQLKFVTFHKRIGQKKNIGFTYGVNLKSISRNLDSSDIATKLIVKSNNNEFANGGSCNIALAKENPSGENFIYDFTYYIKQGLMNEDNLINDLYWIEDPEQPRAWIGLYAKLKPWNKKRDELITEYSSCARRYANNKSNYENARVLYNSLVDQIDDLKNEYYDKTGGIKYDDTTITERPTNNEINAIAFDIERLMGQQVQKKTEYDNAKDQMDILDARVKELEEALKDIEENTAALISKFEQKYIRFIQEASWISEEYIDDNLYYLDAESTLHRSAQPKVSYTINVIELSQLKGYEHYKFDLGDISYVQDTDFFGWKYKDGLKTPYKEEIVITENSTFFDSPEKNTVKAQNYRTAFEDLFQRLAASSKQLQFYSGAYERAADIVDANGNIAPSCLEDAFSNNAYLLSNVANQSVKWDEYGITTTNTTNPAEIVRITSGGIFLTGDGGQKWTTGITANGINAKTITTGSLNTGLVSIYNGNQKSFTWDSQGLNAYKKNENGGYSISDYVRFNQDGIKGIENGKETFSLTQNGLFLSKGTIQIDDGARGIIIDPLLNLRETTGGKVLSIKSASEEILSIFSNGDTVFRTIKNGVEFYGTCDTDPQTATKMVNLINGENFPGISKDYYPTGLVMSVRFNKGIQGQGKININVVGKEQNEKQYEDVYYSGNINESPLVQAGESLIFRYSQTLGNHGAWEIIGKGEAKDVLRIDEEGLYIDGKGVFSGELSAATGSFNGSLSAADGKFVINNEGVNFNNNFKVSINGVITANGGNFNNITATGGNFNKITATGDITASRINLDTATITGTLSADHIDADNLTVKEAATITGKLSADKIEGGTITGVAFNNGSGTFKVTAAGKVTASNLHITGGTIKVGSNFEVSDTGVITAKGGWIGSWKIDEGFTNISQFDDGVIYGYDNSGNITKYYEYRVSRTNTSISPTGIITTQIVKKSSCSNPNLPEADLYGSDAEALHALGASKLDESYSKTIPWSKIARL